MPHRRQQQERPLADPERDYKRKFLVVVDEHPECDRAVSFAAHRVHRTGGTVVLLSVIEPPGFQGLGVEDVLRAEARDNAEQALDRRLRRIAAIGSIKVETVIREGDPAEEIEALIAKDPDIAILVLASIATGDGPGPLVTAFSSRSGAMHIPMTIVPGSMTEEEIISVT
jgi:nucleotide-binding universal stress UspA family protein